MPDINPASSIHPVQPSTARVEHAAHAGQEKRKDKQNPFREDAIELHTDEPNESELASDQETASIEDHVDYSC